MEFRDWNEEMVRRFPIEDYYERSNAIVRWIESRRLAHIRAEIQRARPDFLLEVGCGACHVLERLPAAVRIGIDLSETMLSWATRRTKGADIRLVRADAEDLPFCDACFDAVICTEVLEHVADPRTVVGEVRRVIKPDGLAIFTVPKEDAIDFVKRLLRGLGLDRRLFANVAEVRAKGWHLQDFTPASFRALLTGSFEILRVRGLPLRGLALRYAASCRPLPKEDNA